jgi:hypothetical protein
MIEAMTVADAIEKLYELAEISEHGLDTELYMQVEKKVFVTPRFVLDNKGPLKTHINIVKEIHPEDNTVCETCGEPCSTSIRCEYNSELCVCDKCWERIKELQDLRGEICSAVAKTCNEFIQRKKN